MLNLIRPILTISLALGALLMLASHPANAGLEEEVPPIDAWGGYWATTNNHGGNVAIYVDDVAETVSLITRVPLPQTQCSGFVDLLLLNMPVDEDDGFFQGQVANGGVAGGLGYDEDGNEELALPMGGPFEDFEFFIGGSGPAMVPETECFTSWFFEAEDEAVQHGDIDCSWQDIFDAMGGGAAPSGGSTAPDPTNGIQATDALKILQFVAGILAAPSSTPPEDDCPAPGEQLTEDYTHGDVDCDGDVDAVDALAILREIVKLPQPQPPAPPCVGPGIFLNPYL